MRILEMQTFSKMGSFWMIKNVKFFIVNNNVKSLNNLLAGWIDGWGREPY